MTDNPKDLLGVKKAPMNLIPYTAMLHQSVAHLDGALKYGPYNWRQYPVRSSIYEAAIIRHLGAYQSGENYASDSGAHHLAHIIAGCNILLDCMECGNLIDDRPPFVDVAPLVQHTSAVVEKLMKRESK